VVPDQVPGLSPLPGPTRNEGKTMPFSGFVSGNNYRPREPCHCRPGKSHPTVNPTWQETCPGVFTDYRLRAIPFNAWTGSGDVRGAITRDPVQHRDPVPGMSGGAITRDPVQPQGPGSGDVRGGHHAVIPFSTGTWSRDVRGGPSRGDPVQHRDLVLRCFRERRLPACTHPGSLYSSSPAGRDSVSGAASCVSRILSTRRPSMSTTSKRHPPQSKWSPVTGILPSLSITNPARVW
jgi:hypothetical protein